MLRRRTLIISAVVVLAALGLAVTAGRLNARLLTTAPDLLPDHPVLMAYATATAKPAFNKSCAVCHGADLKGDRSKGAANLADQDWLYGSDAIADIERTIYYGIRSGNPKGRSLAIMPAYAHPAPGPEKIPALKPGEVRDLVEYLVQLEGRPADAAAAARGAALYADKAGCYDCHARDALGDVAIGGPNLADNIWLYGDGSRESLFTSIAQGRHSTCPAWIGRIKPAKIRALAAWIHARSHKGA